MLRFAEIGLLLGPLAAAVVWLRLSRGGGPPPRLVGAALCGLALLAAALVWMSQQDRIGRYDAYVPAQALDGRIIPGHATGHAR
jgi:hypothetical protein